MAQWDLWLGMVLSLLLGLDGAAAQSFVTPNPLFHKIIQSDIAIELIDAIKLPPSSDHPPLARLNFLYHAGDGSGRLFVNDMNGKIHVIHDGIPNDTPFLDVAAVRKSYLRTDELEFGLLT